MPAIERVVYHGNVVNKKSGVVHAIVTTMYKQLALTSHVSQCGRFNPGVNHPAVAMIQRQVVSNDPVSVTCKLCKRSLMAHDSLFNRPKILFEGRE